MPAPYSCDLSWRIVELRFMKNKSKRSIARRLRLSISTVYRVLERFCQYGDVRPGKIGRPDISTILSKAQLLVLMDYVIINPTRYYKEMETYLRRTTGSSSSNLVGLHRILKRFGYSHKRVSYLVPRNIKKPGRNIWTNFSLTLIFLQNRLKK